MARRLTQQQKSLILSIPAHRTTREVAKLVGCGHTAVAEFRKDTTARRPALPPVAAVAPTPGIEPEDEADRLNLDWCCAFTDEESRATAIAYRRHTDPDFAAALDRGESPGLAAYSLDPALSDLFREPTELAMLARRVGDFHGQLVRERGQSKADFEAECKEAWSDAHARSVAWLESALAILRAEGVEGQKP